MPHQDLYNKIFTEQTGSNNRKEFLKNVINDNPYFSIAHFYLLKATPSTDHEYKKIAATTALHFNNPFWLRYQLNKKIKVIEPIVEVERVDKVQKVEEIHVDEHQHITEKVETVEAVIRPIPEIEPVERPDEHEMIKEIQEIQEIQKPVVIKEAANIDINIKPAKKMDMLFEPLSASDYFASQGIKLSEEVQSGDKLGKQLKSFTDWLKTMKKVHQGKLPEQSNMDVVVQNMAEKSNKEPEVLTEAMAEVYIQQGKKEKASDIYKKLSLLNPSKNAYFAAKLELLKEN